MAAPFQGFSQSLAGTVLQKQQPRLSSRASRGIQVQAATQTLRKAVKPEKLAGGTQKLGTVGSGKKVTTIEVFSKEKTFRNKQSGKPQPKILARVEQLRLLSKLEQSGLLSAIEKSGVTLTALEKSGALSLAENLGLISAAADPSTPGALYGLSTLLLAAGPALVYFTPDDSSALIALQAAGALLCAVGGSAAFGGAQLLSTLQKSN